MAHGDHTMPLSLNELIEAFLFVEAAESAGGGRAIVCRRTGRIYLQADFPERVEFNDELPADVEDEDEYRRLRANESSGSASPGV